MNKENQIKELIRSWYHNKAKNETEPFYKFLCLWICFNAWLDFSSEKNTDAEMINWLVSSTAVSSDLIRSYENMSITTVGRQHLENLVSFSPIKDARGDRAGIVIASTNDRENIIRAIYRVRCNLFHGGKQLNNSRDIKLINCVNGVLGKWIPELIAIW